MVKAQVCPTITNPLVSQCTLNVPGGRCRYYINSLTNLTRAHGSRSCATFCNRFNMDCAAQYDTTGAYRRYGGWIGCHHSSCGGNQNCGMIGRPRDFLPGYNSVCRGGQSCVTIGQRACDYLVATGQECWGFGIHNSWGVQIYSPAASDSSLCNSNTGLRTNRDWNTYERVTTPCNSLPIESRHSCDFIGDSADPDWTCDCVPRTPSPTTAPTNPTTTTTVTATTITAFQGVNRSLNAILSVQQSQQVVLDSVVPALSTLSATMSSLQSSQVSMAAAQSLMSATNAGVASRISAALSALPSIMLPAVPTAYTCPGDPECAPQITTTATGDINVAAVAGEIRLQGSTCSVDPCELRESLRQVINAFNNLG